jgi:hypothetical protein
MDFHLCKAIDGKPDTMDEFEQDTRRKRIVDSHPLALLSSLSPMRTKKSRCTCSSRKRQSIHLSFLVPCLLGLILWFPSAFAFSSRPKTILNRNIVSRHPWTHRQLHSSQSVDTPEPDKLKTWQSTLFTGSQKVLTTIHASPWLQLITVLIGYTFHLVYLTQRQFIFPIQWWASPGNEWRAYRYFVGIGYDSLAGIIALFFYYQRFRSPTQPLPPVLVPQTMPWKFPPAPPSTTQAATNLVEAIRNQYSWPHVVHRATFLLTMTCLITAYFATGRFSVFWQDILYELSAKGFPLTTPQFRAWSVLLGHLSWVGVGSALLFLFPFAPRFFRPSHPRELASSNSEAEQLPKKPWHWFRFQFSSPRNGQSVWVWW